MPQTRAIITTKFGKKNYSAKAVARVESTHIDSGMDTDSDSWQISVGDVDDDLIQTLRRDNEVRVSIFALDRNLQALHTGFADEVVLDETEILQISGRDISAPAVDSILLPNQYKNIRPQTLVAKQARALGIGDRLRLASARPFKKFNTDGSETYWEAWYRFYRKRRMWLWCEPDGYITADHLNYSDDASIFIGTQTANHKAKHFLPVERVEWRKSTTDRVGQVWVFGERGDNGFVGKATDPGTNDWVKRPRKIIQSTDAHNSQQAVREAWEEIFESKVGSVEWRVVVANPGFVVRQNRMAYVNIPKIGLKGTFFVVGTRIAVDESGFYQEVRLREKNFAISRRKPDDPVLEKGHDDITPEQEAGTTGAIGVNAHGVRWWDYFVKAARKTHGQFGYTPWLAFLLGVCEGESHFKNERGLDTEDWYKPPSIITNHDGYIKWRRKFANEQSNPLTPSNAYAVGPLQLYSSGLKRMADAMGPAPGIAKAQGKNDPEYLGGRWNPEFNILVGAGSLREWGHGYPGSDKYFREIYAHYNGGTSPPGESYAYYDRVVGPAYKRFLASVPGWIKEDNTASPSAGSGAPATWNRYVIACVAFLKKQLGKSYVYAAAGPLHFDCSGLAGQAWHAAGVRGFTAGGPGTRYGSTFTFWNDRQPSAAHFIPVQKAHILAGDFVFFQGSDGGPGRPGHMGVAIGDGMFIQAPHTGDVVKKSAIAGYPGYVGALRHPQMWSSLSG